MLKAPFPWFGGKSRAAGLIWDRFGNAPNYVEPFAGSLAVLLARPHVGPVETVNDLDCYLANFWRAVAAEPVAVAEWASWPVNEADILARHEWLLSRDEFRLQMRTDAHFYDAKIAGWWVWGLCSWIGSGWCVQSSQQLPHLGDNGRGDALAAWFSSLSARLSRVRVACGEWDRVLGDSVTTKHGITAVLLDPPYDEGGHSVTYSAGGNVSDSVRQWAIDNGDNPLLRIALCGYEDEHASEMPLSWEKVAWKAHGGYARSERGKSNRAQERVWFSPHCLRPSDRLNFDAPADECAVPA